MKEDLTREVVLDEGVTASLDGSSLKVKGPKGEVERGFLHPRVTIEVTDNIVVFKASKATKREKKILGSFQAHLRNIVKGVQEPHVYKLKICSGHFPMNVSVSGQELVIKNFLGESVPRRVDILPGAEVKVNGNQIEVTSPNKEVAGQTAAKIEESCKIKNRDIRIFQDGCYITQKAGKSV